MPLTYEPIVSLTISNPSNTVSILNIPQNFTDLVLSVSGQSTGGGSEWYMWPNLDVASNETKFSRTYMAGTGSSAISGRQHPGSNGGYAASICWATNSGTNSSLVNIMNYSNSTTFKTSLISMNILAGAAYVTRQISLYASLSPITSLQFGLYAGQNFAVGTTFNLFGIKAA